MTKCFCSEGLTAANQYLTCKDMWIFTWKLLTFQKLCGSLYMNICIITTLEIRIFNNVMIVPCKPNDNCGGMYKLLIVHTQSRSWCALNTNDMHVPIYYM